MKKLNETTFTERELKIFKEIQEYAKKYQTKKVVLFGSRARRTNCEKSDIDLAVYGCSDVTEFYFDIEEEVNGILTYDRKVVKLNLPETSEESRSKEESSESQPSE